MSFSSQYLERLIDELGRLPSIGRKTAQRLAFHILRSSREEALTLAEAIVAVKEKVGFCSECGSNLFYHLKEADRYIMCTGTFDDQSVFELVGEIYIDEKPPGYDFAGEHPRQTGEEFMASLQQS